MQSTGMRNAFVDFRYGEDGSIKVEEFIGIVALLGHRSDPDGV